MPKIPDKNSIDLIVYDFDGVMTNNTVILDENGVESVVVNRADGLGIGMIKNAGLRQIILSTEKNKVVSARAKKLNIECFQDSKDKKLALTEYCAANNILLSNVLFIGNDINDQEAMQSVGIPVCPNDAHPQIKEISKIKLKKNGGEGVIRELADLLFQK